MNDIDRSVESFDFAMRRRFTWKEITAEDSISNMGLSKTIWETKIANLNEVISNIDGLNASYHIGGAYFLDKEGKPIVNEKADELWEIRLEPLLKEYLRGMPDMKSKLADLDEAYKK
jgi:hypothetical protein